VNPILRERRRELIDAFFSSPGARNAHASTNAIGKPASTSTTMTRASQVGNCNSGNMTATTCITSQPTTA